MFAVDCALSLVAPEAADKSRNRISIISQAEVPQQDGYDLEKGLWFQELNKSADFTNNTAFNGARDRNRTGTAVKPGDFKSLFTVYPINRDKPHLAYI